MANAPKRRPDALRVPRPALPLARNEDPDLKLKKLFAPLLGSSRVHRRMLKGGREYLVLPTNDVWGTSLYFPSGHPMQGEDRYHWFLAERQPDGTLTPGLPETGEPIEANRIKIGYKRDDPHADDPAVQAAMEDEYQQRYTAALSSPEYHSSLLAKGVIDRDEYVERLRQLGYDVDGEDKPVPVKPQPAPAAVLKPSPAPAPAQPAAPANANPTSAPGS